MSCAWFYFFEIKIEVESSCVVKVVFSVEIRIVILCAIERIAYLDLVVLRLRF